MYGGVVAGIRTMKNMAEVCILIHMYSIGESYLGCDLPKYVRGENTFILLFKKIADHLCSSIYRPLMLTCKDLYTKIIILHFAFKIHCLNFFFPRKSMDGLPLFFSAAQK